MFTTQQTTANEQGISKKGSFDAGQFIQKYGILLAFIIICVILSVLTPAFLKPQNLINVIKQVSISAVLAIGVTYVILTGGIDLGLGSYVAITGCLAATIAQVHAYPVILPIMAGILFGVGIGAANGVIITKGNVAPFIVTLGMMTITRGGALVISKGRPVSNLSDSFNFIGGGSVLGIPLPIIILVGVFIVSYFILNKTRFGRYVYAVGGNEEAARASGVSVGKIKMLVYTICGGAAGLSGIIQASRITTGQPNIGIGYELDAIAAVVIGGTSLSGGIGKVTGTIIGALIIGVLNNGLDLLNVSSYYQQIIKGLIIIGAVLLDRKTVDN